MALFGNSKKRQEKKAAKRQYKLEKKTLKLENKANRRAERTARAEGRQNTRVTKTQTRQDGKTTRTQTRQDARTTRTQTRTEGRVIKSWSRDRANEVAYENGMQPTIAGTAMGTLMGAAAAAGAVGQATSSIMAASSGIPAGMGQQEDTYTDSGYSSPTRKLPPSSGMPDDADTPTQTGFQLTLPIVGLIAALIYFFTKKKQ